MIGCEALRRKGKLRLGNKSKQIKTDLRKQVRFEIAEKMTIE